MPRALLLCLLLAACHPAATPVVAVAAGAAASVAVFGRSPVDIAWSLAAGRDCSIVHWDKGEPYCRPREPPPPDRQFCTRTLGMAECFADPASLPNHPASLGDGPATLNAAQEKDRTARWGF
jgi:hypothetical protein